MKLTAVIVPNTDTPADKSQGAAPTTLLQQMRKGSRAEPHQPLRGLAWSMDMATANAAVITANTVVQQPRMSKRGSIAPLTLQPPPVHRLTLAPDQLLVSSALGTISPVPPTPFAAATTGGGTASTQPVLVFRSHTDSTMMLMCAVDAVVPLSTSVATDVLGGNDTIQHAESTTTSHYGGASVTSSSGEASMKGALTSTTTTVAGANDQPHGGTTAAQSLMTLLLGDDVKPKEKNGVSPVASPRGKSGDRKKTAKSFRKATNTHDATGTAAPEPVNPIAPLSCIWDGEDATMVLLNPTCASSTATSSGSSSAAPMLSPDVAVDDVCLPIQVLLGGNDPTMPHGGLLSGAPGEGSESERRVDIDFSIGMTRPASPKPHPFNFGPSGKPPPVEVKAPTAHVEKGPASILKAKSGGTSGGANSDGNARPRTGTGVPGPPPVVLTPEAVRAAAAKAKEAAKPPDAGILTSLLSAGNGTAGHSLFRQVCSYVLAGCEQRNTPKQYESRLFVNAVMIRPVKPGMGGMKGRRRSMSRTASPPRAPSPTTTGVGVVDDHEDELYDVLLPARLLQQYHSIATGVLDAATADASYTGGSTSSVPSPTASSLPASNANPRSKTSAASPSTAASSIRTSPASAAITLPLVPCFSFQSGSSQNDMPSTLWDSSAAASPGAGVKFASVTAAKDYIDSLLPPRDAAGPAPLAPSMSTSNHSTTSPGSPLAAKAPKYTLAGTAPFEYMMHASPPYLQDCSIQDGILLRGPQAALVAAAQSNTVTTTKSFMMGHSNSNNNNANGATGATTSQGRTSTMAPVIKNMTVVALRNLVDIILVETILKRILTEALMVDPQVSCMVTLTVNQWCSFAPRKISHIRFFIAPIMGSGASIGVSAGTLTPPPSQSGNEVGGGTNSRSRQPSIAPVSIFRSPPLEEVLHSMKGNGVLPPALALIFGQRALPRLLLHAARQRGVIAPPRASEDVSSSVLAALSRTGERVVRATNDGPTTAVASPRPTVGGLLESKPDASIPTAPPRCLHVVGFVGALRGEAGATSCFAVLHAFATVQDRELTVVLDRAPPDVRLVHTDLSALRRQLLKTKKELQHEVAILQQQHFQQEKVLHATNMEIFGDSRSLHVTSGGEGGPGGKGSSPDGKHHPHPTGPSSSSGSLRRPQSASTPPISIHGSVELPNATTGSVKGPGRVTILESVVDSKNGGAEYDEDDDDVVSSQEGSDDVVEDGSDAGTDGGTGGGGDFGAVCRPLVGSGYFGSKVRGRLGAAGAGGGTPPNPPMNAAMTTIQHLEAELQQYQINAAHIREEEEQHFQQCQSDWAMVSTRAIELRKELIQLKRELAHRRHHRQQLTDEITKRLDDNIKIFDDALKRRLDNAVAQAMSVVNYHPPHKTIASGTSSGVSQLQRPGSSSKATATGKRLGGGAGGGATAAARSMRGGAGGSMWSGLGGWEDDLDDDDSHDLPETRRHLIKMLQPIKQITQELNVQAAGGLEQQAALLQLQANNQLAGGAGLALGGANGEGSSAAMSRRASMSMMGGGMGLRSAKTTAKKNAEQQKQERQAAYEKRKEGLMAAFEEGTKAIDALGEEIAALQDKKEDTVNQYHRLLGLLFELALGYSLVLRRYRAQYGSAFAEYLYLDPVPQTLPHTSDGRTSGSADTSADRRGVENTGGFKYTKPSTHVRGIGGAHGTGSSTGRGEVPATSASPSLCLSVEMSDLVKMRPKFLRDIETRAAQHVFNLTGEAVPFADYGVTAPVGKAVLPYRLTCE